MSRTNCYIVLDLETTSKSAYLAQPVQLAAVAVDAKKLEIIGTFDSLIKPIFDPEECKKLDLEPPSDDTYRITKLKKEEIEKAPELKVVWNNFCSFVNTFNYKKNKWDAPVVSGYNIVNYDLKIINRIAGGEPYKFGPYDDEYKICSLFNPIWRLDLLDTVFLYFESMWQPKSLSLDSLRKFMGMSSEGAHNAAVDTRQTAELLIRFLRLTRSVAKETKFENAFGGDSEKA
jgi:DNA polymerase III epsilon subunit-like protein